jgi:vacuolar-type H+-ATPase subunit C/Vma6
MGSVEAFYYIKRVELNNLIRVADLLRQEVPPAEMARRLIRLA